MSGGHFNYSQNRINDVVEHLEYLLDDEEAHERRDTYSDATLQKFKEAAEILKKAFVYTQRIDWLLSGDDGEETFHERLEEDLNKIEPDFVRVGDGTLHGAIDYWQERAAKAEAEAKLPRWIPVSERLPVKLDDRVVSRRVLVLVETPMMTFWDSDVFNYENDVWNGYGFIPGHKVIGWMDGPATELPFKNDTHEPLHVGSEC